MLVETIEHNGFKIEIHQDQDAESPREWDNLGTMICAHKRYCLGDIQTSKPTIPDDAIVLPLFLYDHSGISMSVGREYPFNCPWDAGQVGVIYVTREKALEEFSAKRLTKAIRDKAIKCMVQEVETYDLFIRGEVYGYIIKDDEDNDLGSCWGFIGMDHCLEDAKSQADGAKSSLTYAI
jgi:signal recognition particle subunit SEC65